MRIVNDAFLQHCRMIGPAALPVHPQVLRPIGTGDHDSVMRTSSHRVAVPLVTIASMAVHLSLTEQRPSSSILQRSFAERQGFLSPTFPAIPNRGGR